MLQAQLDRQVLRELQGELGQRAPLVPPAQQEHKAPLALRGRLEQLAVRVLLARPAARALRERREELGLQDLRARQGRPVQRERLVLLVRQDQPAPQDLPGQLARRAV